MLMIRLSRVGKKKHPIYRVVISEKQKDTVGDYLELLGHYDPHTNTADLKAERIKHWLEKGAQPSGTVHNLLVEQKIISGEKIKVANIKKKKEEADADKPAEAKKEETPVAGKKPEEKPTAEVKVEEKPETKKEDPETSSGGEKKE